MGLYGRPVLDSPDPAQALPLGAHWRMGCRQLAGSAGFRPGSGDYPRAGGAGAALAA